MAWQSIVILFLILHSRQKMYFSHSGQVSFSSILFLPVAKYCNPLSFLTQWPSIAFRSCCSTGAWDGESSRNTAANNALKYSYFTFTYAYWIARSTRGFYHSSDFNEEFCHKSSGPNQPWIYKAQDVKDNNQSSLNRWFGVRCINKEVNASLSEQRRCQQVFLDLIHNIVRSLLD